MNKKINLSEIDELIQLLHDIKADIRTAEDPTDYVGNFYSTSFGLGFGIDNENEIYMVNYEEE